MQTILISVQPEWLEKILSGEKTGEVRKTMPKCKLPCRVVLYCTKGKGKMRRIPCHYAGDPNKETSSYKVNDLAWFTNEIVNGKVLGEFILNEITDLRKLPRLKATGLILYRCAMDMAQYHAYGGRYVWNIDGLKVYDKPKELSEFLHRVPDYSNGVVCYSLKQEPLTRAPQSWRYVEEKGERK